MHDITTHFKLVFWHRWWTLIHLQYVVKSLEPSNVENVNYCYLSYINHCDWCWSHSGLMTTSKFNTVVDLCSAFFSKLKMSRVYCISVDMSCILTKVPGTFFKELKGSADHCSPTFPQWYIFNTISERITSSLQKLLWWQCRYCSK